jgi:hypothetical protein
VSYLLCRRDFGLAGPLSDHRTRRSFSALGCSSCTKWPASGTRCLSYDPLKNCASSSERTLAGSSRRHQWNQEGCRVGLTAPLESLSSGLEWIRTADLTRARTWYPDQPLGIKVLSRTGTSLDPPASTRAISAIAAIPVRSPAIPATPPTRGGPIMNPMYAIVVTREMIAP